VEVVVQGLHVEGRLVHALLGQRERLVPHHLPLGRRPGEVAGAVGGFGTVPPLVRAGGRPVPADRLPVPADPFQPVHQPAVHEADVARRACDTVIRGRPAPAATRAALSTSIPPGKIGEPQTGEGMTDRSAGRMTLQNQMVNPVVRLLLRSPAHRLLSGRVALITVTGRRTGRLVLTP
jgi:hypothetical protein